MDKKKASLWTLFAVVFLDLVGFGLVLPIFAPLFIDPAHGLFPADFPFEMRSILLGLFLGSYAVMMFFSTPILGALSDKHGRKKLLLLSLAGTVIGYLIIGIGVLTRDVWLLFAGRILDGITGGNISIAQAAIADLSDRKSKAKNFGMIGMAFGLGFIVGPFLGGKLADPSVVSWFNIATPFWFTALFSLAAMLVLFWKFDETLEKRNERVRVDVFTGFRNVARGLGMRNLRVMFLVLLLFAFGFSFFQQFFQVFLIKRFSFNQSQIGDFFAFLGFFISLCSSEGAAVQPFGRFALHGGKPLPSVSSVALLGSSVVFNLPRPFVPQLECPGFKPRRKRVSRRDSRHKQFVAVAGNGVAAFNSRLHRGNRLHPAHSGCEPAVVRCLGRVCVLFQALDKAEVSRSLTFGFKRFLRFPIEEPYQRESDDSRRPFRNGSRESSLS